MNGVRFFSICAVLWAASASADELLVFAAASTTEAVKAAGAAFEERTGHKVSYSFAGSNELARQIEAGAPADVFLSADLARMDALERSGKVRRADRVELLSNELVVVVPVASKVRVEKPLDLLALKRLAIADPTAVPAGLYAKQWLQKLGAWDPLSKSVIPTLDVRAALAAATSGRVDAAIVYRTDAQSSAQVRIAFTVPKDQAPQILYPVAPLAGSKQRLVAEQFVGQLKTEASRELFEARGFTFLPAARGP